MRLVLLCLVLVLPALASAQDWSLLERPGAIALMRHALAPGTGDPAGFRREDCATQRNLDAAGRAQARRIGTAMRDAGITVDVIWSSGWCRCRETARLLGLGEVTHLPALDSHFAGRGDAVAQAEAVIGALAALPDGARPLLVTHQVNVSALTGRFARSGEIVVVRRDGRALTVLGTILIAP
ncbi:histidine phosphatase family protein [Roseovarius sp. SCSIO 43702]|uniref:histidine phosphatase family protein n=1 Tax=Roseovarius sp. SCSIO 43702 TaxID=2823043 RepID=UPI001C736E31|nr:histidine phosphatase family protein [Roseovarius sp. SCSIO 43702]QYX58392.1 histidine phosphatase family protein [Roseovarius sp. SCSIO 43702]